MSEVPENLKYTKDHEWLRHEDDGTCVVGITDHAQDSLGDVTFVELPAPGSKFEAAEVFGVVESVKAASDLYAPLAGEVVEVNETLLDSPELVNGSPYADGWMIRLRPDAPDDTPSLLAPDAYRELT